MKWEYLAIESPDRAEFIAALNHLGNDGWEAISGTYAVGKPVTVPIGSAGTIERPGPPQWLLS